MGASKKWLKAIVQIKLSASAKAANSEAKPQKQPSRWNPLKSCRVIDQDSVHGGSDDDVGENGVPREFSSQTEQEEWAAIRIQTAFRAFLARRALCALRGLVRLQAAINGHNAHKNSIRSLRSIQSFVRMQAQIRAHRSLKAKGGQVVPKKIFSHTTDARSAENEDGWCDTIGSVEEIQARVQQRQEASIKRERALSYAFSNQWRANSRLNLESLFDYDLNNSTWSWIWLDRWINSQTVGSKMLNTKIKSIGQVGEVKTGKAAKLRKSASADSKSANSRPSTPTGDDYERSETLSHGADIDLHPEHSLSLKMPNDTEKQGQKLSSVSAVKKHNWRSWSILKKDTKEDSPTDAAQKLLGSNGAHKGQDMDAGVDSTEDRSSDSCSANIHT